MKGVRNSELGYMPGSELRALRRLYGGQKVTIAILAEWMGWTPVHAGYILRCLLRKGEVSRAALVMPYWYWITDIGTQRIEAEV